MIQAITTCVHYADFLAETLPHNRHLFDRLIVVTAPEDHATRQLCEHWNVECVLTDAFESRWGKFCKGAAINAGLAALNPSDWIVHLDADIMLPPLTRSLLNEATLDPRFIYGMDRYMCPDYKAWRAFVSAPAAQLAGGVFVHPSDFPLGARLIPRQFGGWLPIGFFQMWHASSKRLRYPQGHTTAAREDVAFAAQWPRAQRAFLPECIAYHLESEAAPMGANWAGRSTARFADSAREYLK